MVELGRIELPISSLQMKRINQLCYSPNVDEPCESYSGDVLMGQPLLTN